MLFGYFLAFAAALEVFAFFSGRWRGFKLVSWPLNFHECEPGIKRGSHEIHFPFGSKHTTTPNDTCVMKGASITRSRNGLSMGESASKKRGKHRRKYIAFEHHAAVAVVTGTVAWKEVAPARGEHNTKFKRK